MKGEIVLLIISAAIFISYIQYITFKYGVQKSISESYYDLPKKWQFIFTLTLWGFAVPIMIVGDSAWFFLAGSLICAVGAAPAFKSLATEYNVHMIGAYGGVILGFAGLVFDYHYYSIVLIAILAMIIMWFNITNKTWWIEILAFATVWIGILTRILW